MITIIGAGPAGSYLAYLLAKQKKDVRIFEEHKKIGEPIQCTGITTSAINKFLKLKYPIVINKINHVKVFSPNEKFIEFNLRNKNYVVNRAKLDQHISEKAIDAGADINLEHKYITNTENKIILKYKGKKIEKDKGILVGADGPSSSVAKENNMFGHRKFVTGLQARTKIKHDKNTVEFWLGFGSFAWVVPESNTISRIGLVSYENTRNLFNSFMKKRARGKKIINMQAGPIPIYNPRQKTQKYKTYLIGDAATQVKASSFGGLVQSLTAAKSLAKAITESKNYQKLWKKEMGRDLKHHLIIRKTMDHFKPKDYNKLLNILTKKKVKNIIQEHERDYPSKFIFKLIFAQPKLLRFLPRLFF